MSNDFTSAMCPMLKRNITNICMILLSVLFITALGSQYGFAEDITLQWDPSPSAKVRGYKVYSGTEGDRYSTVEDIGKATSHIVRGLSKDEHYIFSVTAYDTAGFESIHSNPVHWGSRPPDTGPSAYGSSCLIATVAYGHPQAKEVVLLRQFRDRHLETNPLGRMIISAYEWISPPLTDLARRNETFRFITKWTIKPIVYVLAHPQRSATLFISVSTIIVGMLLYRRRKRKAREQVLKDIETDVRR